MRYAPENVGQMSDRLASMASEAPEYTSPFFYDMNPENEFESARQGLSNIKSKLGKRAYAYLLARVEENWDRLQTGDAEDLKQLKLSFGEMSYFLAAKKYKAENLTDDLVTHTNVR